MQQCDFVREPWIHDVEENGLSEVGEPAEIQQDWKAKAAMTTTGIT